jgi:hypothetical protein
MILAYRMVRLIETHSQDLVRSLQQKINESSRCSAYRNVPPEELARAVGDIYLHLGEWLLGRTEADIQNRYQAVGARRAAQRVPLSQVIWCIALVKENLWEYLRRDGHEEEITEIFGEMQLLQLLEQFFDRAMYFSVIGYEQAVAGHLETQGVGAGR